MKILNKRQILEFFDADAVTLLLKKGFITYS